MQVRLLFFASIKDIVGAGQVDVEIRSGSTVGSLLAELEEKYPRISGYRSVLLTAVNEEYAKPETTIADGDEVAFFPPVSGG